MSTDLPDGYVPTQTVTSPRGNGPKWWPLLPVSDSSRRRCPMSWEPGDLCPGCNQRPCVCVTISLPHETSDGVEVPPNNPQTRDEGAR